MLLRAEPPGKARAKRERERERERERSERGGVEMERGGVEMENHLACLLEKPPENSRWNTLGLSL